MPEIATFQFYSDTNQNNAVDEIAGMALDDYYVLGTRIVISQSDMSAMGDSIEEIMKSNGGRKL